MKIKMVPLKKMVPGPNKKNGARPHFQTERWTRQLQNGAWHHFLRSKEDSFALLGTNVAISKKEKKG
jgi:hypothetical protein